jgi:hypothetical protein
MYKSSLFVNVSSLFSKLGLSVGLLVCSTFFVGCLPAVPSDDASALAIAGSIDDTGNAGVVTSAQSLESLEGCPDGGILLELGIDENGNGELDADEVDGTNNICHGTDGAAGTNGVASAGLATSAQSLETLEGCPNGGILLRFGIDENGNGELDANEKGDTSSICHGTDGAAGINGTDNAVPLTADELVRLLATRSELFSADTVGGLNEQAILGALDAAAAAAAAELDTRTAQVRSSILDDNTHFTNRVGVGVGPNELSPKLTVRNSLADKKQLTGNVFVAPDSLRTLRGLANADFISDLRVNDRIFIGDELEPYIISAIESAVIATLNRDALGQSAASPYFTGTDLLRLEAAEGAPLMSVNARGDLSTYGVIEGDNVGRVTFTNPDKGESVRIPEETLIKYCGDIDGCQLRLAMTKWSAAAVTSGEVASKSCTFFYNPETKRYRANECNRHASNDESGTNGDVTRSSVARAWSCYLSDHTRVSNVNQPDDTTDMHLVNVGGSGSNLYNYPGQTCSATIID